MILNTECTVVRPDENAVVFAGGCMWQETSGFTAGKNGEQRENFTAVFIPEISADIKDGDCIIRGNVSDPERVIREGMTVMKVTRCDFGSADMRHIELEVK
ncbi:MAG: hypothetical protein NC078_04740 [Ruminococcus sp.]|nr:hypothetical protein [Ruminococcus sp.]